MGKKNYGRNLGVLGALGALVALVALGALGALGALVASVTVPALCGRVRMLASCLVYGCSACFKPMVFDTFSWVSYDFL